MSVATEALTGKGTKIPDLAREDAYYSPCPSLLHPPVPSYSSLNVTNSSSTVLRCPLCHHLYRSTPRCAPHCPFDEHTHRHHITEPPAGARLELYQVEIHSSTAEKTVSRQRSLAMPLSKLSNLISNADDDGSSSAADSDQAKAADAGSIPEASDSKSHISSPLAKMRKSKSKRRRGDVHWCAEPGVSTNGTASSCQLFSIFKAMATGKDDLDGNESEVSIDSDSEVPGGEEVAADWGDGPPIENNGNVDASTHDTRATRATSATNANTNNANVANNNNNNDNNNWYTASDRAAGDRFAAASLNNFSAIGADNDHRDRKLQINADVEQALDEMHIADEDQIESPQSSVAPTDASTIRSTPATSHRMSHDSGKGPKVYDRDTEIGRFNHDDVPEEEKVATIIAEFGNMANKMVNADGSIAPQERLLAEAQGTLFKGVMMLGNLHLTNYRLLFHALLPPDSAFVTVSGEPDQTDEQANARFARPDIIKSGNVVVHREGVLKAKRRVWMELSPDMLTTYPSGDEAGRVRPLYSILLSHALRLSPYDPTCPNEFFLTYDSPDGERVLHFSVDNAQSANQWRRLFEGVLFRQARQRFRKTHMSKDSEEAEDEERWSMIRCCVPLDRVLVEGTAEYHSFATLIKLAVKLDRNEHVTWQPDNIVEGNYNNLTEAFDRTPSSTPTRIKTEGDLPAPKGKPIFPKLRLGNSRSSSRDSSPVRRSSSNRRTSSPRRSVDTNRDSHIPFAECEAADPAWMGIERTESLPESRSQTPFQIPYMDSRLNAAFDRECFHAHAIRTEDTEWGEENTFQLLIALMNEAEWFADSLREAVDEAHTRRYKEGDTPNKMQLDVGGYDCLALDDDIENRLDRTDSAVSTPSMDDDEDEEAGRPRALIATRKAEKAAMAARVFGLRESEGIWLKRCYIDGIVPARGHIILTPRFLCFWRRANVGKDIKYRFESQDIRGVRKYQPLKVAMHGLAVEIHGHHDLLFDFWKPDSRNEVLERIQTLLNHKEADLETSTLASTTSTQVPGGAPTDRTSVTLSTNSEAPLAMWEQARNFKIGSEQLSINPEIVKTEGESIQHAAEILAPPPDLLMYPRAMSDEALSFMPFVANRPFFSRTGWNVRLTPRRFTMLTIGSRGDVQPYIALALRLMEDGHQCVIVTHDEFKTWIEGYGIEHRQAGGDPTALMKLSTEHAMFSPGFFKEALGGFRKWLDQLLIDSWAACRDADVLIESPSTMSGIHIAEALSIPYFRAFTMPWTRTTAYPQAFMVPTFEMGPSFNYSTYVLFDSIIWRASSGQINKWRKRHLNLPTTDQSSLSVSKVPFLYNFSPAVVPKPLDWNDDITITGYWNLENSDMEWTPPDSLIEFMAKAKEDNKPIVYIGFGSIVVPDPAAMTKSIVKGVEKAGVAAIIAKGWSARGDDSKKSEHIELSASCYAVEKVPHSWLFPKIDAALHHGGAGTVGASLRAGLPTLIKPWFGDQYFWALRVTKLGVGLKLGGLRSDDIAAALRKATTDRIMIEKAARIGERISSESGVDSALNVINYSILRAVRDRHHEPKKEESAPLEVIHNVFSISKKDKEKERPHTPLGERAMTIS